MKTALLRLSLLAGLLALPACASLAVQVEVFNPTAHNSTNPLKSVVHVTTKEYAKQLATLRTLNEEFSQSVKILTEEITNFIELYKKDKKDKAAGYASEFLKDLNTSLAGLDGQLAPFLSLPPGKKLAETPPAERLLSIRTILAQRQAVLADAQDVVTTAKEYHGIDDAGAKASQDSLAASYQNAIDRNQDMDDAITTVVHPNDPNIPIIMDQAYLDRWMPNTNYSKTFSWWGDSNMVMIQNSLTDYRTKSLDNDIGVTVQASFSAITEAVRVAAAVAGVSLPSKAGQAQTLNSTPAVASSRVQAKIDEKKTSQIKSILASLRNNVTASLALYQGAANATQQALVRQNLMGQILRAIADMEALSQE